MTKLVAPASLIQAAIPDMLKNTPDSFFRETMEVFENNAILCYSKLKDVVGLKPVMPEGALYMMVSVLIAGDGG
jgi:tyrosine aminotransferase